MSMNVTVIGTGFVGVVSASVFADFGNQVWGLDIDPQKVESLRLAKVPFYEPDLENLVRKGLDSGRLQFTTDYETAVSDADVLMIAVGTPSTPEGQADLTYVIAAAKSAAKHLKPGAIVVVKSTVPPGTNDKVAAAIKEETKVHFYMASLPEFLKEGSAVYDTLNPDRVVIGADDDKVVQKLKTLHAPLNAKTIVVKPESAQMSKYTANAYLAMRITFINQIANLCEQNGADVQEVIKAMGPDKRIGQHYWYPGLGYGGSCFPKDVKELAAYSKTIGEDSNLLIKIDQLNEDRIPQLMERFSQRLNGWDGKRVAVLGLSFKPNTDDIREAPSLKVIPVLKQAGAQVVGYDPKAAKAIKRVMPQLEQAEDVYEAIKDADVTMVLIEWPELISLELSRVVELMRGTAFIDVRNQYRPKEVFNAGLEYIGVGR